MDMALLVSQMVNGLQLGVLLFLVAAGLTLVFGILDFVNLAHGAFYMLGAFVCAVFTRWTGSWPLAVPLALPVVVLLGMAAERLVARPLYGKSHLAQVLATFGLLLVIEALAMMVFGAEGMGIALPGWLDGRVELAEGVELPVFRLLIIASGLTVAAGLYVLVHHSRFGMLVRAAAANRGMAEALGVDTGRLFSWLFALGTGLAGLAGMLVAPLTEASLSMGVEVIIVALVIIIIGGIGSLKGAFVAAMLVGMIDTMGRAWLDDALKLTLGAVAAETAAPAISAMSIYILMAVILAWRPRGLFPPRLRGEG